MTFLPYFCWIAIIKIKNHHLQRRKARRFFGELFFFKAIFFGVGFLFDNRHE